MKEEIETKHFEHTVAVLGRNRAAEPPPHSNRSRCLCVYYFFLFVTYCSTLPYPFSKVQRNREACVVGGIKVGREGQKRGGEKKKASVLRNL